jgi:hypothetical protein
VKPALRLVEYEPSAGPPVSVVSTTVNDCR